MNLEQMKRKAERSPKSKLAEMYRQMTMKEETPTETVKEKVVKRVKRVLKRKSSVSKKKTSASKKSSAKRAAKAK